MQPHYQPRRDAGAADLGIERFEPLIEETPIDQPTEPHQLVTHVDHLIEPRPKQVRIAPRSRLARLHHPPRNHRPGNDGITFDSSGKGTNHGKTICQILAGIPRDSGNYDYFNLPENPGAQPVSEFFTDDGLTIGVTRNAGSSPTGSVRIH